MAILLMIVIVGLMLSALLIPTIITQARTSNFAITRVQALDAAQSGIDVALGLVRVSVTDTIGDSSKLPCGPLTGDVDAGSDARYSVTIEYLTRDPLQESTPVGRAMKCIAGYGTFDNTSGMTTPAYARLTSLGTAGNATNGSTDGRTLSATYVFRTSNVNLLGGLIAISAAGTTPMCMAAGSPTAPAAAAIRLQPCSTLTPPAPQQVFAYRTDLTLQLLSSISEANPDGLCVNSAHTPALAGDPVLLAQCGSLGSPAAYTQQWSHNAQGHYQVADATSATTGTLPNLCLNVAVPAADQPVVLGPCGSTWLPDRAVGPGAAALPQFVNFGEYGRCLDAPGKPGAFLIAYPCQQNPSPAARTWNQLFQAAAIPTDQASATGPLSTNDGQQQCLTS
ncbi:MAG: RICIN domain-containing protein, partial [Nakamurella sp.]